MRIALLGDIALIGRYDRTIDSEVDKRVEYIKNIISDCDFVIANQESVLTDRTRTMQCKGVYLRSARENVKTLQNIGVTHVTLANNHIYDYGTKGMRDTVSTLANAGIMAVGLCNEPEILEKDGCRVMLDGFCCLSANALRYGNRPGKVQLLSYGSIDAFLRKAEEQNCLPIVSAHFGVEGLHYPSTDHIKLFRKLAQNHDYILHGNHPHSMQGIEEFNNSLLIYAQGNLCFDNCTVTSIHEIDEETVETRKGYVVILDIENNKLEKYEVIPYTDNDDGILRNNSSSLEEIKKYSEMLGQSITDIEAAREAECSEQIQNRKKRDAKFYLHRMNPKYAGAFINGRIHATKYHKLFKQELQDKTMIKDKISILMSVYNCEDTLRQSIDSVLTQTYTNWEFIICNDCSTDGTQNILDEYKQRFPDKFMLIRNDKNMHLAYSLNHCLQHADGEFSVRMDGDDYIAPDKFEKQVEYLRHHPQIQLCGTWMQTFDKDKLGRIIKYKEFPTKTDLRKGPVFAHATIMMYTEAYMSLGGYTVSARTVRSQDYDLWFRFFAAGYSGGVLPEALYYVREDSNAFLRRKPRLYLWATVTRVKGFKLVNMPLYYYPFVLSPLVSMGGNELRKIKARSKRKEIG